MTRAEKGLFESILNGEYSPFSGSLSLETQPSNGETAKQCIVVSPPDKTRALSIYKLNSKSGYIRCTHLVSFVIRFTLIGPTRWWAFIASIIEVGTKRVWPIAGLLSSAKWPEPTKKIKIRESWKDVSRRPINKWPRERPLVEVQEIDTKTNLPILFLYRHDLC